MLGDAYVSCKVEPKFLNSNFLTPFTTALCIILHI